MIPTRTLLRNSRHIHTTARLSNPSSSGAKGKDPSVSQGHAVSNNNRSQQDPQSQAARAGLSSSDNEHHLDAASSGRAQQSEQSKGNPEGVGFQEQIGGKSGQWVGQTGGQGKGGQEEASPPGWFAAVKSKIGLGTSEGEVKQNRGGGEGVTSTGTGQRQVGNRGIHTNAVRLADRTRGVDVEGSRKPKDEGVQGEQNPHLKHKSGGKDKGKGNAAEDPVLPSHQSAEKENKIKNSSEGKNQFRGFATSAVSHGESLKPAPVDADGMQQQRRSYSTSTRRMFGGSAATMKDGKHDAESYFKDVDETAPPDEKTHSVAYGAEVQRASEPPSGEWSRKGAESKEYDTISKDEPYTPPAPGAKDQKLSYGNREEGKGGTSQPGEGPEGASKGGRMPER